LSFIGKKEFTSINDTLKFAVKGTDTDDYIRREYVRVLKMGLIRYISRSKLADKISITYEQPSGTIESVDAWNYWVFKINGQGYFNGEQSRKFASMYGSLSADRVTHDLKVDLSVYGNYNDSKYVYDTLTFRSITRGKGFNSSAVFSLTDHWSFGGWLYGNSSSYQNIDVSLVAAPAIEYNLFRYEESTRRQLKIQYQVGFNHRKYLEETIYDKTEEDLLFGKLSVILDVKEPWGSLWISLAGQNYYYDFTKNDISLNTSVSFQLITGLSLNLYASYSALHDQLELPRADATEDDVVLQRKELESQYSYTVSAGLTYSFGSIYNNIVNPRF
jgi:hypothetical protein